EAHIYLPSKLHLLSEHTFISQKLLYQYLDTPLKSQIHETLNLNIAIYNIQGFNDTEKKLLLEEY
ncbi:10984_t:CDS:1, partial [Cetraspora pellucida]